MPYVASGSRAKRLFSSRIALDLAFYLERSTA